MSYYESIELEEQIKTTADLIEHYGMDVTLVREPPLVPDGAGGRVRDGSAVPQEPKRRFFQGVTTDSEFVVNVDGEQVRTTHVLVGMPDDDIQQNDEFELNDQKFKVVWMHPFIGYEVKGRVIQIGN